MTRPPLFLGPETGGTGRAAAAASAPSSDEESSPLHLPRLALAGAAGAATGAGAAGAATGEASAGAAADEASASPVLRGMGSRWGHTSNLMWVRLNFRSPHRIYFALGWLLADAYYYCCGRRALLRKKSKSFASSKF